LRGQAEEGGGRFVGARQLRAGCVVWLRCVGGCEGCWWWVGSRPLSGDQTAAPSTRTLQDCDYCLHSCRCMVTCLPTAVTLSVYTG
jgi:hypothetical protein